MVWGLGICPIFYLRRISLFYLLRPFIFSNFLISFGASGLLATGFVLVDKEFNYYALTFTFCSTLFMYNLQRIHKLKYQTLDVKNSRHQWIISNKKVIQSIIVICALILVVLIPFFHWKEVAGLSVLGIISFFYSYKTELGNLRSLPGMKIFWIALVWAFTVSIFTVGETIVQEDLVLFIFSFTFIVGITIPFDIRDMPFDSKSFKTIPQLIGESSSRFLAVILIWISFSCSTFLIGSLSVFLSLVYGIFSLIILGSTSSRKELYYSGLMDFTLILLFIAHYGYEQIDALHF